MELIFLGMWLCCEERPQTVPGLSCWSGLCLHSTVSTWTLPFHSLLPHLGSISPSLSICLAFPVGDGKVIPVHSTVLCWFIHRVHHIWAQDGLTLGSQCWALAKTRKGKLVKGKEDKILEKLVKELGVLNFQKKEG